MGISGFVCLKIGLSVVLIISQRRLKMALLKVKDFGGRIFTA